MFSDMFLDSLIDNGTWSAIWAIGKSWLNIKLELWPAQSHPCITHYEALSG